MQHSTDNRIAVIGAGVVGLCVAYALRRSGRQVSLYDPNPPGSQCSYGNAGAISSRSVAPLAMPGIIKTALSMLLDPTSALHVPVHYWAHAAPWLWRFMREAEPRRVRRIAAALDRLLAGSLAAHAKLAAEVGCPELVHANGQLHLYPDERALAKDEASWRLKQDFGLRVERLDGAAIRELEPAVADAYRIGLLLPDEGWIANPWRYTQAIMAALQQMGAACVQAPITALGRHGAGWSLSDGASRWQADQVIVCAGAWSRALLAQLGHDVPLESQRGYHLQVVDPGLTISRTVVLADRKVFITPMENGLRIAGTVEFGGLHRPPNVARAMLLRGHALAGLRGLRVHEPEIWMGHRPCLPDSLPVLGPVPDVPGLWCAFGHGHLGLTGSANTATLLARAMAGEAVDDELAPFSIARFARARR